ncbi:alcohol O-acetyltransferase NDAI_0D01980 [Naumovozyma dairenensis CBS 421]|uniref:Alcohol acetyltransferase n=1 Tax=Naumovozyma dairenensis (strain ATCC 10597 / BCRC 20456 / CBS 421 / NBRC 0211 / NRRL Y-12639) TaxID=1071378 RepID=G0W9Q1_NAUDC|nr:hypothetical protein NDAI_0D01980 [Naumovozyma dairenensis CBS 421]CCD24512.1 hypothetical protein NDAI_0D01980 [Naumovozyma dairenensis CBS 421]
MTATAVEIVPVLLEESLPVEVSTKLIERGHARRMGHLENYFALLQRQELYTNFQIYGEFNEPVSDSQLRESLREILFKHPILAHTIIPKDQPDFRKWYQSEKYLNTPYPLHDFIRILPELKLSDILINKQQEEYSDILPGILNEFESEKKITSSLLSRASCLRVPIYDPKRPNWRLLRLSPRQFIYVSNHCCSDAISGVNLFQDIAEHLSSSSTSSSFPREDDKNDNNTIFNYNSDWKFFNKLYDPITDKIEYRPKVKALPKFACSIFVKSYLSYFNWNGLPTMRVDQPLPLLHKQFQFQLLEFTNEELNTIRDKIKTMGCTFTPFLQACWFIAMYKCGKVFNLKSWKEWAIDIAVPSSSRRFLIEEDDNSLKEMYKYGSNVGGFHYSYLISSFNIDRSENDKFFELVQYYQDGYSKSYENGDHLIGLGIMMMDGIVQRKNIDKMIKDDYLNQTRAGVLFSNAGFFPQDESKKYHVTDLVFNQAQGSMKFSFGLNIASTNVNGLKISVNVAEGTFDETADFAHLCNEFKANIVSFGGL